MPHFRKKPVVIEAVQWSGNNLLEIVTFIDEKPQLDTVFGRYQWESYVAAVAENGLIIQTLEGQHIASFGDWIIKGVKGEFYPCKPDIFAATYERIDW